MFINGTVAPVNFHTFSESWKLTNFPHFPYNLPLKLQEALTAFSVGWMQSYGHRDKGLSQKVQAEAAVTARTGARSRLSLQAGLVSVANGKNDVFKKLRWTFKSMIAIITKKKDLQKC